MADRRFPVPAARLQAVESQTGAATVRAGGAVAYARAAGIPVAATPGHSRVGRRPPRTRSTPAPASRSAWTATVGGEASM